MNFFGRLGSRPCLFGFLLSTLLIASGCKSIHTTPDTVLAPHLVSPLEFAEFTVADIRSAEGATNFMSQKISVGGNSPDAYEILAKNAGATRIHVETTSQYLAALKDGYAALNTYEITMESFFETTAAVLEFMSEAKPSHQSYLGNNVLKRIPVSVLSWNDGEERGKLDRDSGAGLTIHDCTASYVRRRISDFKIKDHTATFSDDTCNYWIKELARGDYDHDGIEDELLMVGTYYQGGSGRGFEFYIASRTDPQKRTVTVTGVKF